MKQYTGPVITRLRKNFARYFATEDAFNAWYDIAYNVSTARGIWLDMWGRIVGQTRFLKMTVEQENFGFEEGELYPFDEGTFFESEGATYNYRLDDESYRLLIKMKAFANLNMPTVPNLNMMLMTLFGDRGRVYVVDLGDMEIRIVFAFPLKAYEIAILNSGIVPHPGGVHVNLQYLTGDLYFGFKGSEFQPFNVAPYFNEENIDVS